jgi:PTS system beta-glucosides-specific IIC component
MSDYHKLVSDIINNVGSSTNIKSATHCATRLRLHVADQKAVDVEKLKEEPQILGTVFHGDELQLVIGPDVPNVYAAFEKQYESGKEGKDQENTQKRHRTPKEYGQLAIDFVSGTFVPILPVLVAAGLVSAVLNIGVTFFGLSGKSGTYTVLNAINTAGFYFLPMYLGFSAARKLGINEIMGLFLGGVLVTKAIDGVGKLSFLGISIPQTQYNTTTIPVIFGVLFMAVIDRQADKVIPKSIKYFFKPLIVMMITVPVTLILLGPLGNTVGGFIATGLSFMYQHLGWLSVGLMGALTPLLVMTGTNQALFPLVFAMMAEFGYDSFVMPGMLAANTAIGAAALSISLVESNLKKKELAFSAGITGVMGITEPSVFGVLINYKSAFMGAILGGGVAGLFAGLVQLKQYAVVSPGLAAIPTFIPTNGAGLNSNFWFSIVAIAIAVTVSFTSTYLMQKQVFKKQDRSVIDGIKLTAPVSGKVIPLAQVPDKVFSQKMMGDGIAIDPVGDTIDAPFDGVVLMTTKTNHAIGMQTDSGLELLIHVGLDTVNLKGDGLKTLVKQGQRVKKGDSLIKFDRKKIESQGYSLITPIIVTNSKEHMVSSPTDQVNVRLGDYLFLAN